MQKMTHSLVRRGHTGPQSWRSPELVTCARRLSKATSAAAAARVGQRIFMKFNIKYISKKYTKEDIINETVPHNDIEEAQGYKPTSPQAQKRKKKVHKLRAQAWVQSQRALEPGNRDRDGSAQAPGYKQQGQKYFFYA